MAEILGLWVVALAIALAVVSAEVASAKGNSSGAAALGGLLFGPLGLLMAWAYPVDGRALEDQQLRRREMRRCPACAELVRVKAIKCRYCGDELPPLLPLPEHAVPRLTQATLSNWPSVPKLPKLTRKGIVAIVAAVGVAITLAAGVAAYNAGYRFVTPAEWWQSLYR